jgi:hypothetical protein
MYQSFRALGKIEVVRLRRTKKDLMHDLYIAYIVREQRILTERGRMHILTLPQLMIQQCGDQLILLHKRLP